MNEFMYTRYWKRETDKRKAKFNCLHVLNVVVFYFHNVLGRAEYHKKKKKKKTVWYHEKKVKMVPEKYFT